MPSGRFVTGETNEGGPSCAVAQPVKIRPLASGDEAVIAAWFEGLGPETRYPRFLAGVHPNYRTLSELARVDHRDREALTAAAVDGPVGVAGTISMAR